MLRPALKAPRTRLRTSAKGSTYGTKASHSEIGGPRVEGRVGKGEEGYLGFENGVLRARGARGTGLSGGRAGRDL